MFLLHAVSIGDPVLASRPRRQNELALEKLRDLEYSPRHNWTHAHRELLCVLWHHYRRSADIFPKIFNTITGSALTFRKMDTQYSFLIRSEGFSFHRDRKGLGSARNKATETLIEETAKSLGLKLQCQNYRPATSSRHISSAHTKVLQFRFEMTTRSTRLHTKPKNPVEVPKKQTSRNFCNIAPVTDQKSESSESVDSSDSLTATVIKEKCRPRQPSHIGFRAWDVNRYAPSLQAQATTDQLLAAQFSTHREAL